MLYKEHKLGWDFDLGQYFPVQIENTAIMVFTTFPIFQFPPPPLFIRYSIVETSYIWRFCYNIKQISLGYLWLQRIPHKSIYFSDK